MPSPRWINISSPRRKMNWGTFANVVAQGFKARYVPEAQSEYQKDVSHWKIQPTFTFKTLMATGRINVQAVIHGFAARVWIWLNEGVAPRFIMPREGGVLAFTPSGPGRVAGPSAPGRPGTPGMIFSRGHWWPGIEARNYDARVTETLRPRWIEICRAVFNQAMRLARR